MTALAPDRYRFHVTIAGGTLEKLRLAKDMLRHAIPTGDESKILDRAFDALLAELARARFAATASPGAARATAADSRHVPADVKRAVWLRDLGRCAFVAEDGRRCNERGFVEFHHVRPYAVGGPPTVENIQLRCRRHNGYEARLFFAASRERDEDAEGWAGSSAGPPLRGSSSAGPPLRGGSSATPGLRDGSTASPRLGGGSSAGPPLRGGSSAATGLRGGACASSRPGPAAAAEPARAAAPTRSGTSSGAADGRSREPP